MLKGNGGSGSSNNLYKHCYFLNNHKSVWNQKHSLLLSNPHPGPASALAPTPILPCAAPVDNPNLVTPLTMTQQNYTLSPTSVPLDPLVGGPWVLPNPISVARLRDPTVSTPDIPSPTRSVLDPLVKPWYQPPSIPDAVLQDPPMSKLSIPPYVADVEDPLRQAAVITAKDLRVFDTVTAFIRSRQQPILVVPQPISHPAADLLHSYVANGFPAKVGPCWPFASIRAGIEKRPHMSATSTNSPTFAGMSYWNDRNVASVYSFP